MSHYALVTGAAKGIGRAIALELSRRGYHLLLADIDDEQLRVTAELIKSTYHTGISLIKIDLSDEDAAQRLWQWSAPFHDGLDIVVNNAGYGLNAPFTQLPLSAHLNLVNLNIRTLMSISYFFVPVLNKRPKGFLLNVGSTTSFHPVPFLNTYASSKAFVLSFTRGLRTELLHSRVSVSCLSPGSTDTHFVHRAGMSQRTKQIAKRYNMTAEQVAGIAIDGLLKGRAEIIPGISNKAHSFLTRFFPKSFAERLAANVYRPEKNWDYSIRSYRPAEEEDFAGVLRAI